MHTRPWLRWAVPLIGLVPLACAAAPRDFSLGQVLEYPFANELTSAEHAEVIAWVRIEGGVRNIWLARAPDFRPVQLTRYTEDDGQELTHLTFAPDGRTLGYVRGGDHDANWPAEGHLAPDPASSPEEPVMAIWSVPLTGGAPTRLAPGDAPAISSRNEPAYIKDDQVWSVSLTGGKPARMFFDRGKDSALHWSPDGQRLAFVSNRGDHSLVGVFSTKSQPILYLAPSTGFDESPRWSFDGTRVAFVRRPGEGGPPEPMLRQIPHPWSIWVASATDGTGRALWRSPETLSGSFPEVEGEANLHWAAGDRLVFLAYLDDWPHLYSLPAGGGAPVLLTPGAYMVEHVTQSRDHRFMIFDANTGSHAGDADRRHLFRVPVDQPHPVPLTSGDQLEWSPVAAATERVAFIVAGAAQPPAAAIVDLDGRGRHTLAAGTLPADFPLTQLVVPRPVSFQAQDGTTAHGQIFETAAAGKRPAVIFVHGGPPRQMLLGWHYMRYYSNAYAVNQYLAAHGFVVLSVNYRLGIGYGRAFHQPDHAGPAGASEYQDVLAGAQFLRHQSTVDAERIGLWGGSYGGYLTALALARNSDLFRSGVDIHGVHDWSQLLDEWNSFKTKTRYEKGDHEEAVKVAWESSPDAAVARWRSPVLLIQGDDDRNVPFHQTVDLARRLEAHHVAFETLVIPNETHDFLRESDWARADAATVSYLSRTLHAGAASH